MNGVFVATLFCKVYNHSVRDKTDFKCHDDNFNEILLKIMGLLPIEKKIGHKNMFKKNSIKLSWIFV